MSLDSELTTLLSPYTLHLWEKLFESLRLGVMLVNQEGIILYKNNRLEDMFFYEPGELPGQSLEVLLPSSMRERHKELRAGYFAEAAIRRMGEERSFFGERKDGSSISVEVGLVPLQAADEVHVFCIVADREETASLDSLLRTKTWELEQFLRLSWSLMFRLKAGDFAEVNFAFEALLGYPKDFIKGTSFQDYLHPDETEEISHRLLVAPDSERSFEMRFRILHRDQSWRWIAWTISSRGDGNVFALGRDITPEMSWQQEEWRQRLVLEESNRLLSNALRELRSLAYVISHDLKSPLHNIRMLSDWLQEEANDSLTEQHNEYLSLINEKALLMERLLDQLLHYTLWQETSQSPEWLELNEFLKTCIPRLPSEDSFLFDFPTLFFKSSASTLEQVFRSLLDNAVKHHHTGKGRIVVKVEQLNDRFWKFSVCDDGPGIASEYQEQIFRLFQRLPTAREKHPDAIGMGLALADKVVRMQGGRMSLESAPGQGACFSFTWPRFD